MAEKILISPFWMLGTDTEVGKTHLTTMFALIMADRGLAPRVVKPVAAGTTMMDGVPINADTEALRAVTGQAAAEVTPWLLSNPTGPWSAAQADGQMLTAQKIAQHVLSLSEGPATVIAEGIGGVAVPLNENETWLDVIRLTRWPVILVVGLKLGCINHTLLTMMALEQAAIPVSGVVLNELTGDVNEAVRQSSINEIRSRIPNLCLMPYCPAMPSGLAKASEILDSFIWP